jgi:hypothetical protein
MLVMGVTPLSGADAARMEVMRELWTRAGLESLETREIAVQRTFADFDDDCSAGMLGSSVGPTVAAVASDVAAALKSRVRACLPAGKSPAAHAPTR